MSVFLGWDLKSCPKCWFRTGADFARGMLSLMWWRQICPTQFYMYYPAIHPELAINSKILWWGETQKCSHGAAWKYSGSCRKILYLYPEMFLGGWEVNTSHSALCNCASVLIQQNPVQTPTGMKGWFTLHGLSWLFCQLALVINLWRFIPVSVSFYPFMDLQKKIPFQGYRSWWITERKKHTGTFQREWIMLHTVLGKSWEEAALGFSWEMLKQKGHYNSKDRAQGKDTGKPASKLGGWKRESFFFWCFMT